MENEGVPIDKGWAWVILGGCMTATTIHIGTLKSYGIFFVEILETFKTSVSMTSLITAIQTLAYILTSIPVLSIGVRFFTCRQLILVGALLCIIGYGISSLAMNLDFLIFSLSLLVGVGGGLAVPPLLVILGKYFKERRGIANGINMAGGCLGGLILPVVFRYFLDTFGLRGALLLTSGCYAHIILAASLLRPPEFYMKKTKKIREFKPTKKRSTPDRGNDRRTKHGIGENEKLKNESIHNQQVNNGSQFVKRKDERSNRETEEMTELLASSMPNIQRQFSNGSNDVTYMPRSRAFSESRRDSQIPRDHKSTIQYLSNSSLMCPSYADIRWTKDSPDDEQSKIKNQNGIIRFIRFIRQLKILDFTVLRQFQFVVFLLAIALGTVSGGQMHIFLPVYAKEAGMSNNNIVVLVSIIGACDFIGRISSGFIADYVKIRTSNILVISQIVMCILTNCARLCQPFWSFSLFSIIAGVFGGMPIALCPALINKILGTEKFPGGLAFVIIIQGGTFGVAAPLLGYLRDSTGTYFATFHFMGASAFTSALLYSLDSTMEKLDKKRLDK